MSTASNRFRPVLLTVPFLAALLLHGLAHDRLLIVVAAGMTLGLLMARGVVLKLTVRRAAVFAGVGFLLGLGLVFFVPPPAGPLSPVATSALTGAVMGLGVCLALARQLVPTWICAWGLAALSGNVDASSPAATAALFFLLASFGSSLLWSTGVVRNLASLGRRDVVAVAAYVGLFSAGSVLAQQKIRELEEPLIELLQSLLIDHQRPVKSGGTRDIVVAARSSIIPSAKPLLDLSTRPGRLRSQVMDSFDGHRWYTSPQLRRTTHRLRDARPLPLGESASLEVTMLDESLETIPAPAGTWELQNTPAAVDGGWVLHPPAFADSVGLRYDLQERLPVEEPPGAELREVPRYLHEPLASITTELCAGATTDRECARRIEEFFHANFQYSLETDLLGNESPLVLLVTERRPAYCIYFASAMAVMLRTQDIPARVVAGFTPGEQNRFTGRSIVYERDAHAWVEVWDETEGRFMTYDPTPPDSRDAVMRDYREQGTLRQLASAIHSSLTRLWLSIVRHPLELLKSIVRSPVLWCILLTLFYLNLRRRRARQADNAVPVTVESTNPLLRQALHRFLVSLRKFGIVPRPAETGDELLRRLAESRGPEVARRAAEFLEGYRRARFRGELATPELVRQGEF